MNFRIGEGWDVHALVEGRKLIIGGVEIPYDKGLLGHLMLTCCCTPSQMPSSARPEWVILAATFRTRPWSSRGRLVRAAAGICAACVKKAEFGNIDSTVIAQKPKLAPHIPAMQQRIADALGISVEQVNVKAKTAEKMGPVGELQAMEANAVALIYKP